MIVIPHIDFAVFFIFIYSFILLYHLLKRQSNKKETDVYVDTEGDPGLSSEKKKTQNVDEEIF